MTSPKIGEVLPAVRRHLDTVQLAAYAGATWDWHRLHHDHAWALGRGLPGTVVDGQLFGALLAEQAQNAFGLSARLTRMRMRFNAMVFAGETVTVTGEIVGIASIEEGLAEVTMRHDVHSDAGTIAVRDAQTVVRIPSPGSNIRRAWEVEQ